MPYLILSGNCKSEYLSSRDQRRIVAALIVSADDRFSGEKWYGTEIRNFVAVPSCHADTVTLWSDTGDVVIVVIYDHNYGGYQITDDDGVYRNWRDAIKAHTHSHPDYEAIATELDRT